MSVPPSPACPPLHCQVSTRTRTRRIGFRQAVQPTHSLIRVPPGSRTAPGARVLLRQLDLANAASVDSFATWLEQETGGLTILINNAGESSERGGGLESVGGVGCLGIIVHAGRRETVGRGSRQHEERAARGLCEMWCVRLVMRLVCLRIAPAGFAYKGNIFGADEAQTTIVSLLPTYLWSHIACVRDAPYTYLSLKQLLWVLGQRALHA